METEEESDTPPPGPFQGLEVRTNAPSATYSTCCRLSAMRTPFTNTVL